MSLGAPLFLLLLAACASGVTRPADSQLAKAYLADPGKKASGVVISLTPEAKKQAAENLKFNQEVLLSTLRRGLEARELLAKQSDQTLPNIEVVVTDIRIRSNFSAVVFGFMAGDDRINGDVIVRAPTGEELQRFGVSASYALGGIGGMDDTRMNWLYESFAERTIEELMGVNAD